jgi:hypothetical protein
MKTEVFERLKGELYQSPDWESLDHDTMVERMVELTVRECADVVRYYYIRGEPIIPQHIKRHFGVE